MSSEGVSAWREEPVQRTRAAEDYLPGIEPGDLQPGGLLGRVSERFPLGRGLERVDLGSEPPSGPETRPFGLRYLTPVAADRANVLDLSEVTYDPEAQMSTIGGELFIFARTKDTIASPYDTEEDIAGVSGQRIGHRLRLIRT